MASRTQSFLKWPFKRRNLNPLLERLTNLTDLSSEVRWLTDWTEWLRHGEIPPEFPAAGESQPNARLRYFVESVQRKPEWSVGLSRVFASVLAQTHGLELFCQTGISEETRFIAELMNRVLKRVLPAPPRDDDFSRIFTRIFSERADSMWVPLLRPDSLDTLLRLASVESSGPDPFQKLRASVADSLLVLGANLVAVSQTPEIRRRLKATRIIDSPFFQLNLLVQTICVNISASNVHPPECAHRSHYLIAEARASIQTLYSHLEESGVSVSLVYDVEHQLHILRRMETLLTLLLTQDRTVFLKTLIHFISRLIDEHFETLSVRGVIENSLHLLSRKIVERTGHTGEHYITRTRREYYRMLNSASGGGFVTVGTAALKSSIMHLGAAPFFEGFFAWVNYSGSFILMQLMGFTLATKQPSMTASTLAGKLKTLSPDGLSEFVSEVAMITRSQFAAAIGNLGVAIPIGICADLIAQMFGFGHIYPEEKAISVIRGFDPLHSWAVPCAAMTGGFLWLSSLCAGWFENYVVYHEIPRSITDHRRLNAIVGKKGSSKIARWLTHQSSGFAGNASLGFFLGFFPVFSRFFGLPFDVFHVTLSTVSLTFACSALWATGLGQFPVGIAAIGIGLILILNFGVSFLLALFVAAKARKIPGISPWPVMRPILEGFVKSPGRFFFPTRS